MREDPAVDCDCDCVVDGTPPPLPPPCIVLLIHWGVGALVGGLMFIIIIAFFGEVNWCIGVRNGFVPVVYRWYGILFLCFEFNRKMFSVDLSGDVEVDFCLFFLLLSISIFIFTFSSFFSLSLALYLYLSVLVRFKNYK